MRNNDDFNAGRQTSRRTAVIFDVDGTLADVSSIRHHVVGTRQKNFNAFHEQSVNVPPHPHVVQMAHDAKKAGHDVIVVTARKAQWRPHTAMWLAQNNVPSDAMFMRADNDQRPDYDVKQDIYNKINKSWDVVHAVDDNPNVLRLWAEKNIPTTRVPGWVE
jgi:phosphoglycolate phosphatase-like HAD superfamily hydrolase